MEGERKEREQTKEVSELLEGEDVEHQVCTPGAHKQNVPVERCVKEVQAILNKKCELRREGWSEVILRVQEGLNMRLVKPLGSTPFDLLYLLSKEGEREERERRKLQCSSKRQSENKTSKLPFDQNW